MKNILTAEQQTYLRREKRRTILINVSRIGFLVLSIALWELFAVTGVIDSFITSSPSRIVRTLIQLSSSGNLWKHIGISTYETVVGFISGTALGTAAAVIMWWSDFVRKVFEPYVVVLNSLPKIALGPIIIIWAGTGTTSIIVMAILISVVITTLSMLSAFCQTSPAKILLLKTMNATKLQIFLKLIFPSNIPALLSCLKINVGMAWVGTIMGEYLVSKAGLGYLIVYGGQIFQLDLVMTCTITLCILAGGMYGLVALLEKKVVRWN